MQSIRLTRLLPRSLRSLSDWCAKDTWGPASGCTINSFAQQNLAAETLASSSWPSLAAVPGTQRQPFTSLIQLAPSPAYPPALQQTAYSTFSKPAASRHLHCGQLLPAACRCSGDNQQELGRTIQRVQAQHKSTLTPRFTGGKLKPYTSYKERFKLTATGLVRYFRAGHRHRRFIKSNKQRRGLKKSTIMHDAYAATMKRMGFNMHG